MYILLHTCKKIFNKTILLLLTFVLSYQATAQSDCSTALRVCNNATTGGNVSGYGIDDFYGANLSGCLNGVGLPAIEVNSFWFRIKMDASGTFGFNIIPAPGEDWDFAVYGPTNTSCGALGSPIRCNWDFDVAQLPSQVISTGVGNDTGAGDHYDTWLNVNVGDEFLILVNKFSTGSVSGFQIEWKGDVFNDGTLDCSLKADLGPDKNLCRTKNPSWLLSAKLAGVNQADIVYNWFADTGSGFVPVPSTHPATPWLYEVTIDGTYKVEVTDTITGEFYESDIIIAFYGNPTVESPPVTLGECEISNNEAIFDLTTNGNLMIGNQNNIDPTNVVVKYYASYVNAQQDFIPLANPATFSSVSRTIWARIENAGDCFEIASFDLVVDNQPFIDAPPIDITVCDLDQSLNELVDLSVNDGIIMGTQTGVIVLYDDDPNPSTRWKLPIQDPKNYIANAGTQTIWAVIVSTSAYNGSIITFDCPPVETSFEVTVLETPIANPIQNLKQCDDDGVSDGLHLFNFTNPINEVLGSQNPSNFDISFYKDATLSTIINLTSGGYMNTNPYVEETIYVKIQNASNSSCFDTTSFTIQVFPQAIPLPPNLITPLVYCDNTSDSAASDANGIIRFDLTQKASEILNGASNITFSINYSDANGPISNPSAYENSIPGGQTIFVELINNWPNNAGCPTLSSFEIQVLEKPVILSTFDLVQCDNNGGETIFNLSEGTNFITLNNPDLTVTYFNTIALAENNNSGDILPTLFSNALDADNIVYARIENLSGCYRIAQVNLIVSPSTFPVGYTPQVLSACDDDSIADGLHTFRLADATAEIFTLFLGSSAVPIISYYRTEDDALTENNPINPAIDYLNEAPLSQLIGDAYYQDIYVRVENNSDGDCFGVGPFVKLKVTIRPDFELDETDFICLNNLPKTVAITNPKGVYTYEWFDAFGSIKNSSEPFLEVSQSGTYSVVATSLDGCLSFQKQIILSESDTAQITAITVSDAEQNSSATISVTGVGDYEFTLDNPQGNYQDETIFYNVTPGIHTVYVNDKNGCGIILEEFYVLGYPRFFTPNFDGINETWNVKGVDSNLFPESSIYIFDRYGKQLYKMTAQDVGWNGIYNGNLLPSTDYWFVAELTDVNGVIRKYKSHFSLIRR